MGDEEKQGKTKIMDGGKAEIAQGRREERKEGVQS